MFGMTLHGNFTKPQAFRHCAIVSKTHFKFPISAPFSSALFLLQLSSLSPRSSSAAFASRSSFSAPLLILLMQHSLPPLFPPSHGRPLPFLSGVRTEYAPRSLDTRPRRELILYPLIQILVRCLAKLSCASHPNPTQV